MTEAWMKRGAERSALIRSSMQRLYGEEDLLESDDFLLEIAGGISLCLRMRSSEDVREPSGPLTSIVHDVVCSIAEFAHSQQEQRAITATLLEEVVKAGTMKFHRELSRQEFEDPQLIFGAPAMEEVPVG